MDFMAQVRDAFASRYVQEVFSEILNSIESALKLDLAIDEVQNELDIKEGELRKWASKENQSFSEDITDIRRQVEKGRYELKELHS